MLSVTSSTCVCANIVTNGMPKSSVWPSVNAKCCAKWYAKANVWPSVMPSVVPNGMPKPSVWPSVMPSVVPNGMPKPSVWPSVDAKCCAKWLGQACVFGQATASKTSRGSDDHVLLQHVCSLCCVAYDGPLFYE